MAPWNAALWVAARRLRLAAEADCDRRVLRAHPDARRYARLLVDVAERALGAAKGVGAGAIAAALLDPPGLLERRVAWLLGAERSAPGARGVRVAAAALATAGAAVVACAVPRPAAAPRVAVLPLNAVAQVDVAAPDCVASVTCAAADPSAPPRADAVVGSASSLGSVDSAAVGMDAAARAAAELNALSATPALRLAGQQPGVDSLFARLRAAGDALARDPRAKAQFDAALDALRAELRRREYRPALVPTPRSGRPVVPAYPPSPFALGRTTSAARFPDADSLRNLVSKHFPQALTGSMGAKPYLWFLLDARGNLVATARGFDGLGVRPRLHDGIPAEFRRPTARATAQTEPGRVDLVLDADAVHARFPTTRGTQLGAYGWTGVRAGGDTVNVLWAVADADAAVRR